MSAPVFVLPSGRLLVGKVTVDGAEGRHAATVLRLRAGEPVELVDGRGRRATGAVATVVGKDVVEVDVATVVIEPPPTPRLVVVQALPKGDRGETAVETMTEVGVDEIVPWAASRCVTRWRDSRGEKALERWRTTAQAAAKQSRRARFPVVTELAGTRDVVDRLRRAAAGVVLHEEADEPLGALDAAGDRRGRRGRRARGRAQPRGAGRHGRRRRDGVPPRADRAADLDRRHRRPGRRAVPHQPLGLAATRR